MITNLAYLKTAVAVLEDGQTAMTEVKILRVMSQICEQNAERILREFQECVDHNMAVNHLVDCLKK